MGKISNTKGKVGKMGRNYKDKNMFVGMEWIRE